MASTQAEVISTLLDWIDANMQPSDLSHTKLPLETAETQSHLNHPSNLNNAQCANSEGQTIICLLSACVAVNCAPLGLSYAAIAVMHH